MMREPYRNHLSSHLDLVTSYEQTRAAFVSQALEKTRLAVPFVEEARAIKILASKVKEPADLLQSKELKKALITASGISDKGNSHIPQEAISEAVQGLIKNYLEPAGPDFVEELVFRFLLTKGDALGGSMRNVIGSMAKRKMIRAIIANLQTTGASSIYWLPRGGKKWNTMPADNADIETMLCGLSWEGKRTIVFDRTPKFVGKNIDIILLNSNYDVHMQELLNPNTYLALGELKGGIDPAGADEHWKTANSALERIRVSFAKESLTPHTFFVGAAIEASMAQEIWNQLESGVISNAANLTDSDQLVSLCNWLCTI